MATLRPLILSFAYAGVAIFVCPFLTHGLEGDSEYPDNPTASRQIVASNHGEATAERAEPTTDSSGTRVQLRSEPNMLSVKHIVQMIQDYGFSHPYDLSEYELAGRIIGDFQHDYEPRTIDGETIVVDHATGLMWQAFGSAKPLVPWQAAKDFVQQLNQQQFAGFSDWRLPTVEELASLLEPEKKKRQSAHRPCFRPQTAFVLERRPGYGQEFPTCLGRLLQGRRCGLRHRRAPPLRPRRPFVVSPQSRAGISLQSEEPIHSRLD